MEWFLSHWQSLAPFLGNLWWEGIAAFMLITALSLSLFELWKVRDKLQRPNAVPEWFVAMYGDPNRTTPKSSSSAIVRIDLVNMGVGTVRDIEVVFQSNNGNQPSALRLGYHFHTTKTASAGELMPVLLRWNFSEPLQGWLIVRCRNRIGERFSQRFMFLAFIDKRSLPVYEVSSE